MPFIIQRKSDGAFYKNRSKPSWGSRPDDFFTFDINECKPFVNVGSLKNSWIVPIIHCGTRQRNGSFSFFDQEGFDKIYRMVEVDIVLVPKQL